MLLFHISIASICLTEHLTSCEVISRVVQPIALCVLRTVAAYAVAQDVKPPFKGNR
jgi:hypothetical protein